MHAADIQCGGKVPALSPRHASECACNVQEGAGIACRLYPAVTMRAHLRGPLSVNTAGTGGSTGHAAAAPVVRRLRTRPIPVAVERVTVNPGIVFGYHFCLPS